MIETQRVINGDCINEMSKFPENSIDLVVTSPPYNVGIEYDSHNDRMTMDEYWEFTKQWLTESYRTLKVGGRICVNIPYEVNVQDRGGRILFMAETGIFMRGV